MTQALSVKCKLKVPVELHPEIDATLEGFAEACNQILAVAKQTDCWNTTKLHHKVYKPVRAATGLKANHVCQAIRRVVGNAKATKQVHKFRPTSISLDVRTFKYIEDTQMVGVTLKAGRCYFPLSIGGYQVGLLKGQQPSSATLNKTRQGDYYINIVVDIPTQPTGKTPKVLGVDLGRRAIASTSTGKDWDGKQLQALRAKYARVRSAVQCKRSRSSRRLLRRLSGREQRFQRYVNHCISKSLVAEAKMLNASLAFEDLTGIRQRAKIRKAQRREHHSWCFYQLRLYIEYKAAIAGIPVVLVNPAYTSKTCHRCLHIGYRDGKKFSCSNCGWHGDADFNGAVNISLLGGAFVTPLEIPKLSCSLVAGNWDKAPVRIFDLAAS